MKNLLFFLLLIFSIKSSFSQKNKFDPNNLRQYLDMYVNTAKTVGVNLDFVYSQRIKMEYINARDLFKLKGNIGLAFGMYKNDEITVFVNRLQWYKLSLIEKMSVMYHELSHDILNAEHDDSKPNNLMHSTNLPKTEGELYTQILEVFKQYFPQDFELNAHLSNNSPSKVLKKYSMPIGNFPNLITLQNMYDWKVKSYDGENVYVESPNKEFDIWYSKKYNNFSLTASLGNRGMVCGEQISNESFLEFKIRFDDNSTFYFNANAYYKDEGPVKFLLKRYSNLGDIEFRKFLTKLRKNNKLYLEIPKANCYFTVSLKGSSNALKFAKMLN